MWLFVFGAGALLLHRAEAPSALAAALPAAPPAWAPYAAYFAVTAALRLAIRDARLRPLLRRARAAAAASAPAPVGVADLGLGVGKGVAQVVVGGDFLGPAFGALDLLVRWFRGASERRRAPARLRRAMARERRRAALCVAALGVACGAQALRPDLVPAAASQALALLGLGL